MILAGVVACSLLFILSLRASRARQNSIIVMVLGDLGRSPRIQNHALCLIKAGWTIDIIAYKGSEVHQQILEGANLHFLAPPRKLAQSRLYVLWGLLRVLEQAISILCLLLWKISKPKVILIQNPPAIPSLILCKLACFLLNSKLVIDWHNYGWSIMQVDGVSAEIVAIAKKYERWLGSIAYAHLTVTNKMAEDLTTWPVQGSIVTLYDRPTSQFKSISDTNRCTFLSKLRFQDSAMTISQEGDTFNPAQNPFVTLKGGKPIISSDKPVLLVSSTSWTSDEDFSILFDALKQYDGDKIVSPTLPRIIVVITGKGPMQAIHMKAYEAMKMLHVKVYTTWLTLSDYPLFLGCADLGVSLHTSSSGLDLPMKVVDMMGARIPVLAMDFLRYFLVLRMQYRRISTGWIQWTYF